MGRARKRRTREENANMTCYMRHLTSMFETLELEYDKPNRTRVDAALRRLLGMGPEQHCTEIWAAYKALSDDERANLVPRVREALGL
jgi:hypothetical protein